MLVLAVSFVAIASPFFVSAQSDQSKIIPAQPPRAIAIATRTTPISISPSPAFQGLACV